MKSSVLNDLTIGLTFNFVDQIRQSLNSVEIRNPRIAKLLCKVIPAHCPFERKVGCFGQHLFYIPPLCKLNPLYPQIMALRLKSLTYLAEQKDEDITLYC